MVYSFGSYPTREFLRSRISDEGSVRRLLLNLLKLCYAFVGSSTSDSRNLICPMLFRSPHIPRVSSGLGPSLRRACNQRSCAVAGDYGRVATDLPRRRGSCGGFRVSTSLVYSQRDDHSSHLGRKSMSLAFIRARVLPV